MKIVVTGASGFLGAHLLDHFSRSEHNMILLKRDFFNLENEPRGNPTIENLMQTSPEIVVMCHAAVSSGIESVDNKELFAANVSYTQKVLETFPASYILYVSSVSVYGNTPDTISESTPIAPRTTYSISKRWGELLVEKARDFGILRCSSIYGQKMKENTIIPTYVNQAMQKKKILVWGNGTRKQNYLNVNDVVIYLDAMINRKSQGIYLGVSDEEIQNIQLARIIQKYIDCDIELCGNDHSHSVSFDNRLTRSLLGVKPQVNIEDGIKRYISWKQKKS